MYNKKLVSKYKKLCKQRRRPSYNKYKETRQTGSDMVKLNNIILKKQRNIICTFGKEYGLSIDPCEETLNALINTHFPNAAEQINKKYTSANNFSRDYIMAKNEDWITEDPT